MLRGTMEMPKFAIDLWRGMCKLELQKAVPYPLTITMPLSGCDMTLHSVDDAQVPVKWRLVIR